MDIAINYKNQMEVKSMIFGNSQNREEAKIAKEKAQKIRKNILPILEENLCPIKDYDEETNTKIMCATCAHLACDFLLYTTSLFHLEDGYYIIDHLVSEVKKRLKEMQDEKKL